MYSWCMFPWCMFPWCMYAWCIYLRPLILMHVCMLHISFILDPDVFRYDACVYDAYIYGPWPWCMYLWCGAFLLRTDQRTDKRILGVGFCLHSDEKCLWQACSQLWSDEEATDDQFRWNLEARPWAKQWIWIQLQNIPPPASQMAPLLVYSCFPSWSAYLFQHSFGLWISPSMSYTRNHPAWFQMGAHNSNVPSTTGVST